MSEQNYNVDQSSAPAESFQDAQAQRAPQSAPQMSTMSGPVNENPSGDMGVKTPYDYLKEAFAKEVANEPIHLEIPNRPGIYIEFDTNISSDQIELWRKQATSSNRRQRRAGGGEGEIDSGKFAALVVFNKATVFVVDGDEVYLPNGKPLNFFEQADLRTILNTNAVTDTELVRAVYKNDAHVLSAGGQVIEAAGYGEELQEMQESPTKR